MNVNIIRIEVVIYAVKLDNASVRAIRSAVSAVVFYSVKWYFVTPGNSDPIGVPIGKGDIIADPLFVDYENRNFRLKENSPARNKGVKLGYTIDLDNYPLIGKNSTDIGAYEF